LVDENAPYEEAVTAFVRSAMENEVFLDDVRRFCEDVSPIGALNGLSQTLVRMCSPGIPDTYQGGELWNQTLVDPDNRGSVDFDLRWRVLREIKEKSKDKRAFSKELLENYADGRIKAYVLHVALQTRKQHADLFARGDYVPLESSPHAISFARRLEDEVVICSAPRLSRWLTNGNSPFPLGAVWGERVLRVADPGDYENLLTGARVNLPDSTPLSRIFQEFPLALLRKVKP
jgi:(1->4)-alpha-D-glucan 1-alpha-D-glucosylmutase